MVKLGVNLSEGEWPQFIVPAQTWQALRIKDPATDEAWSLLGTTVSPGFDFKDFKMGDQKQLLLEFPEHRKMIERFYPK